MSQTRYRLLASAAALALLAATGVASAQDTGKNQGGAGQPGTTAQTSPGGQGLSQGMSQGMQHNQTGGAGKSAQSQGPSGSTTQKNAQNGNGQKGPTIAQQNAGKTPTAGKRNAQNEQKQNASKNALNGQGKNHANQKSAANADRNLQHGRTARFEEQRRGNKMRAAQQFNGGNKSAAQERRGRTNTAQQGNGDMKGLQANTSMPMQGTQVQLNDQQRTTIRDHVINAGNAPRINEGSFDVRVGTVIPREDFRVVRPVPETLVRIDPRWRYFRYFVYQDEVVIVDPHGWRIVAVVPA